MEMTFRTSLTNLAVKTQKHRRLDTCESTCLEVFEKHCLNFNLVLSLNQRVFKEARIPNALFKKPRSQWMLIFRYLKIVPFKLFLR